MRNTGWNFLLTSSLHGTNLTCKTVVNTWQKSSLQLQCINKHVFFGWYYQKSSNLRTFCRKIANFWFTRFRGQFLSKIWMGGSLYFSMTGLVHMIILLDVLHDVRGLLHHLWLRLHQLLPKSDVFMMSSWISLSNLQKKHLFHADSSTCIRSRTMWRCPDLAA